MPLAPISISPGIYTETSARSDVGRYKDGFNVRFFKGNPEKIGGFAKYISQSFLGVCRSSVSWTTLSFQKYVALGTHNKLYLSDGVSYFDITPISDSGTLGTNPFSVVNLSDVVTVADTGHGLDVGNYVDFSGATTVGGLDMNASWPVDTVIDADHYTFVHDATANATTSGGGSSVAYAYEIPPGTADSVPGVGWGAGGWGTGTWGTSRTSNFLSLARIWSLVNWGEDLIASPLDQPIYVWVAADGANTRATLITQAPAQNRRVLLSPQLRILISFGSHDGTSADPMLIRWCDSEDYTDWTPSPTNAAGDKRLDNGNQIISAYLSRDEFAVITDTTTYSMTLSGDSYIFSFADKGQIASLTGPNAACDTNGTLYAMGRGSFWVYDGTVRILPCDVHSMVFNDINIGQSAKVYCARNKYKNEILWFYPSAGSTECDRVVGYNFEDPNAPNWWMGGDPFNFTSMIDQNAFEDAPFATKPDGAGNSYLYQTENGMNADGAALPYYLETFDLEVPSSSNVLTGSITGAGEFIENFQRFFPDYSLRSGAPVIAGRHKFTIKGRKFPNDKQQSRYTYFTPLSRRIDLHMRNRQIALRWESSAMDTDISLGQWRVEEVTQGQR